MQTIVVVIIALAASVAAGLAHPNIYADIYKNTLLPQSRIIGGQDAQRNQFPYQVSLRWGLFGIRSHMCGASLIDKSWALTAGHCHAMSIGSYDVVLGLLKQGENTNTTQRIDVDQFIVHENFSGGVATNDIAVVHLKVEAVLNEAVAIIELGNEEECNATDIKVVLSGWGNVDGIIQLPASTLQFIELIRITNEQCAQNLTEIMGNAGPLDDTMICTGQEDGKKQSACNGDSGGPLVRLAKQVGIVSWGLVPCGRPGAPSVYTRVSSHLEWIFNTTSIAPL